MRFIVLFIFLVTSSFEGYALSEYGSKCDKNSDCRKCKEDLDCQLCMNSCWNKYGPAEIEGKLDKKARTSYESCRLKRAKWCNAQCWDPDDLTDPEYVSTKPYCDNGSYPAYQKNNNKPW